MTISINTALANAMLDTGSFKSLLDGGNILLYSGTMPLNADAALSGNTMICEVFLNNDGATGLTWDTTATGGVLTKPAGAVWAGTVIPAGGVATFYRFVMGSYAFQGTVAQAGGDLDLTNVVLAANATQPINAFAMALPIG